MKVHRYGNTFMSTRITGPTQHFLSVEFGISKEKHEIRWAETQEIVANKIVSKYLNHALDSCFEILPIHGHYTVKRLIVSQKDKPSEIAYKILLRKIILFATIELI